MSSITAQQAKLDLELVPKEKRLEIGKCNGRLNPEKIQREPTFQVVLDALALTLCYSAFLINADVPKVYMHQFWDSVYKHDNFYRFKMDKRKRFKLTLEIFRDIFKICPRVQGQDFDALPTDKEIGMYHQKNIEYVKLLWEDFIYQIDNRAYKEQEKMYYPRFIKVIIHYFLTQDKTVTWRNKIGMHTSKDDYLINTLRFVSAKEATQIYGAILSESLTSPEMKETKAYKTYLSFSSGATPPKKVRKFKKPTSPQLSTVPVSSEEPTKKSKRVKRSAKKSTKALAGGVVIRENPEMPLSKKKEKVDVASGKGIDLLSEVALTEEAQYEEVQRKSLRDFHKTHPSGSSTVTKTAPSAAKIKASVTNEETGVKPGVLDVTEEESSESEVESYGNDEDDSNNEQDSRSEGSDEENDSDDKNTLSDNEKGSDYEHETDENESNSESDNQENEEDDEDDEEEEEDELVKTLSNDSDDEAKITNKAEGDKDEEMGYTTSQLYDYVDIWLNEPVQADDETIQKEGTDAELTNIQQGNENPEISQVIEDAHVTLTTFAKKTKVPVTSSSHSSDLAAKFLNFLDIPHTDAKIVSPMDVYVHHEVPSKQTPTLLTIPVSASSPIYSTIILQLIPSFTPPPPQ
ncbi:hypothetical protein Tco_1107627 [Tanacetum coccineum]